MSSMYLWTSNFQKHFFCSNGYKNIFVFNEFVTVNDKVWILAPNVFFFNFIFISIKIRCITLLIKIFINNKMYLKKKKPAVQDAGADPSQWSSTNRQNTPIQENFRNFWTCNTIWMPFGI